MGNSASSVLFSYTVKFSRETPNDFYLSGDRVQGVIEIVTNDIDNDLNFKYGQLYINLIGELHDFKADHYHGTSTKGVQVFFRRRARVIKLPNDKQKSKTSSLRSYRWIFDGLLDSLLPSSLPPDDKCDPCICYYAYAYFQRTHLTKKSSFLVFTRTSMPVAIRQALHDYVIDASTQHKDVKLHVILPNNGLVVPGQTCMVQIEIDNPMKVTIKSIRATLKQYRNITRQETDFTIFSSVLPGFEPIGFNGEYRQSTYELPIPLEKCRVMAPTSSFKNVRYELHIQCHIHCLFNSQFTLALPAMCTIDHQQTLKIMDELKMLPKIQNQIQDKKEEKPPPSYEDFIASEILPKYEDIIH